MPITFETGILQQLIYKNMARIYYQVFLYKGLQYQTLLCSEEKQIAIATLWLPL